MQFTKEDLQNLSALARITITENESEKMLHDMQAILQYVSEINQVSGSISRVKGVHYNSVRDDYVTKETGSLSGSLLSEAPDTEDGYVKVAQVLK
ncbi:MAG: Glu-tRNAGln amidotransferase subunit [Candidatus Parcubacteria bacterium]|jgi:aspartyl/glutamyl-tRNA(Asn/Gln) amidotransferase C subunit